jgi:hypothetical protein
MPTRSLSMPTRALVRRVAVEIAAEPVFQEEGVEVQQQPLAHRVVT